MCGLPAAKNAPALMSRGSKEKAERESVPTAHIRPQIRCPYTETSISVPSSTCTYEYVRLRTRLSSPLTLLLLHHSETHPVMMAAASSMTPSTPMISCPVRVLLITRPGVLDYYQPRTTTSSAGDADADTTLIYLVSKQMTGSEVDPKSVRHLITRIAGRVWIIFDLGDLRDRCEPPVRAFNVKLDRSALSISSYEHPQIENVVNGTVEVSKKRRLALGADFPSRTDLRKHQSARESARR